LREHAISRQKTPPNLFGCQGILRGWSDRIAILVDQAQRRANCRNLRMSSEISQLPLNALWHGHIVVVHADDDGSSGNCKPTIPRRGDAFVHAMDDTNSSVSRGKCLQDLGRAVGRAVVYDEELEFAMRLAANTFDRGPQIGGTVVNRYQNRDAFSVVVHQWSVEHVIGLGAISDRQLWLLPLPEWAHRKIPSDPSKRNPRL